LRSKFALSVTSSGLVSNTLSCVFGWFFGWLLALGADELTLPEFFAASAAASLSFLFLFIVCFLDRPVNSSSNSIVYFLHLLFLAAIWLFSSLPCAFNCDTILFSPPVVLPMHPLLYFAPAAHHLSFSVPLNSSILVFNKAWYVKYFSPCIFPVAAVAFLNN